MPRTRTTSRPTSGSRANEIRVVGQVMLAPPSSSSRHRPVDLEVVVVLGVERAPAAARPTAPRGARPRRWRRRRRRSSPRTRRSGWGRPARALPRARSPAASRSRPAGQCPGAFAPACVSPCSLPQRDRMRGPRRLAGDVQHSCSCLRTALSERVVVADGAMGTMLQAARPEPRRLPGPRGLQRDPQRHPARRRARVHDAYFEVGVDCVETNTFGANLANLGEYGIADRICELAEAGARIAREVADDRTTQRAAALGARLGRAGHQAADAGPRALRHPARRLPDQVRGMLDGGVDAVLVETAQDLLQAKAAVIGARRALAEAGRRPAADRARSPSRRPARCCSAPRSAPR